MVQNTSNPAIDPTQNLESPKAIITFAAGINENQTPNINEASTGYNFDLSARQTKLIPRAPFDLEGTAPNAGKITGIMQLIKRDSTKTNLVCAANKVYQWMGGQNSILNGTTANGSKVITGISSTNGLVVGQLVTGTGIGAASNPIASIDSISQVTLTVASTASATVSITFTSFVQKGLVTADHQYILNGTTANTSPVITGLSSTVKLGVGDVVTGTGIGGGAVILTVDSTTQVTLTVNSTASGTVAITFGIAPTGLDALLRDVYWSLNEYLVIPDVALNNVVKKWDGATFGSLPTGAVLNGTTTTSSKVITGLSSTAMLAVGQLVTGTGIGAAPNPIVSIDSQSQVTLSVNSTASATVSITFGIGNTAFYAKYSVVHLNRVWYFNIIAGTTTPHLMVASAFENPAQLDVSNRGGPADVGGGTFSTGMEAFYLVTPDLKAINGVSVFQNILIISTVDGRLYKLTGTDSKTFTFVDFYVGSSAIGTESIQNIGNDVVYIRKGGNINMLSSVQSFGDVRSNDISRWIPNQVANITDSLMVYDQTNQKVFFFINGKVLVLFKDILFGGNADHAINSGLSPWGVYRTAHSSYFNTKAAKYMQHPDSTDYSVYWGDSIGNVYDMNGIGANGDGGLNTIYCTRTTKLIDIESLNPFPYLESNLLGRLQYRRKSTDSQMTISFDWSDEFNTSYSVVTLKGTTGVTAYYGGKFYWNGGLYWNKLNLFLGKISHQTFSPTGKGAGFYITFSADTNSSWMADHLELY